MSEILALAASFEAKLKQRASSTDESVKAALEQHESALIDYLSREQAAIESAIRDHSRRMAWIVCKSWIAMLIGLISVIGSGWGTIYLMQSEIRDRYAEMSKLSSAKVGMCGGQKCVEIDTKAPTIWGDYRILKGE